MQDDINIRKHIYVHICVGIFVSVRVLCRWMRYFRKFLGVFFKWILCVLLYIPRDKWTRTQKRNSNKKTKKIKTLQACEPLICFLLPVYISSLSIFSDIIETIIHFWSKHVMEHTQVPTLSFPFFFLLLFISIRILPEWKQPSAWIIIDLRLDPIYGSLRHSQL